MRFPDLTVPGDNRRRLLLAAAELVLVAALAVQGARLVWTLVAPRGGVGDATAGLPSADSTAILTRFDPFFRGAPAALAGATTQAFRLFGVRAGDSGTGSAIIGTPDGQQGSFAVGDEVSPGVRLVAVEADHVVLARGGSRTPLFFPSADSGETLETVEP